jgi:putative flippase GtrA
MFMEFELCMSYAWNSKWCFEVTSAAVSHRLCTTHSEVHARTVQSHLISPTLASYVADTVLRVLITFLVQIHLSASSHHQ